MTTYVWKAKDRFGNSVVREVAANTGAEAKALLEAQGFSDLTLMEGDVAAAATSLFPRTMKVLGEEVEVTAADRIKQYSKPPATYSSMIREGLNQSKTLVLFVIALAAWEFYRGHIVAGALACVGLMGWLTFLIVCGLPSILYQQLLKAGDWYRWDEVLELVEKMERLGKLHFIKVPAPELARWRAKALAGSGKLTEALSYFQRFENQPGWPSWLYKAFVASLFDVAKQHDQALEATLRAIQERPSSSLYRDLAYRYLRHFRDPVKARAALAEADKEPVPELAKAWNLRCRGILALLEGDYRAARTDLESAIQLVQQNRRMPFRDGQISISKAYLCCVFAKEGDRAAAQKNYDEARPYLIATSEEELMTECERALAQSGQG